MFKKRRRSNEEGIGDHGNAASSQDGEQNYLPDPPPVPIVPKQLADPDLSLSIKLRRVQNYIQAFHYNYTGESFFKKHMRKDRGMNHITNVAKEIMRQALPIQCVEALFLAVHLTNSIDRRHIMRIPITFISSSGGAEAHSHIVLGVKNLMKVGQLVCWGALGMSRISTLMYKEMAQQDLAALLRNYHNAYLDHGHELEYISLGLPFPNETIPDERPRWRASKINLGARPEWEVVEDAVLDHLNWCDSLHSYYLKHGRYPPDREKEGHLRRDVAGIGLR